PTLGNNKWYQSLLRNFDQKKNNTQVPKEFALMAKSSSSSENEVEARLFEFKEQEIKFCKKIRGLERDVEVRNNKIKYIMNKREQVKKEKEGLDNKLTGFESILKDLDNLLGSQRSDKNKEGLGYNIVPPPLLHKPTPSIDACNTSDLQSSNFSVSKHGESSDPYSAATLFGGVTEVVAENEVSTDDPVTTAGEVVTIAGEEVSATVTTPTISMDDITLAKVLAALKSAKPMVKEPSVSINAASTSPKVSAVSTTSTTVTTTTKAKGIVKQEPKETIIRTTTTVPF
nr:hypothetical protein [Tanacetum cinerariifolium]